MLFWFTLATKNEGGLREIKGKGKVKMEKEKPLITHVVSIALKIFVANLLTFVN
mgnify:CR=1 FL=1